MKKQKNIPVTGDAEQDEALFQALARTKKKRRRKRIIVILIILVLVGLGIYFGTQYLQRRVRTEFAASKQEVTSAQAEIGSISTVVSGSGMLVNVDTETVTVPDGVEITEILVAYGDTVAAGDMLATVDMSSVRTAMSDLQEQIDELDSQLKEAKGDTVDTYVKSGIAGRVKIIYAEAGERVEDVMIEHGSLMVLSIDGYMAVNLETDALAKGDSVTVTLSNGNTVAGTVDTVTGSNATVILTDNGPEYDEEVSVSADGETVIGTGRLTIHSPLAVTGYAGTVSKVNATLNQKITATTKLFTLTDTSVTAGYNALIRQRNELEETLMELLKIQRDGSIVAPIAGSIYNVAKLKSSTTVTDLATISPDISMEVTITVDEADILSLKIGQTASVTVKSISDESMEGTVTDIDKTYSNSKYTAVITLDKKEGMIAGMTASVGVRIEGVDNAILIPVEALNQNSNGYYVYTSYDEETETFGGKKTVVPGLSNSSYVEIKSGLSEGDTVYYTEQEDFSDMFGGFGGFGGGNSGGSSESSSGGGFGGDSGNPGGGNSGGSSENSSGGGFGGGGMPGGFGG